jgi:hypothetical protein
MWSQRAVDARSAGDTLRTSFRFSQPSFWNTAAEALADLMRTIADTTENIGGISFGIGSLLFFYLFLKSSYIPRALSSLGLAASMIWTILYFGGLVFPERRALFQHICVPPMALADILTGFYLVLFAVRTRGNQTARQPPIAEVSKH